MYFSTKNYLKSTHNHTVKHAQNVMGMLGRGVLDLRSSIIKSWVVILPMFWGIYYLFRNVVTVTF